MISVAIISGCRSQLSQVTQTTPTAGSDRKKSTLTINGKPYNVELAITQAEQVQGLSDRDSIGSDGMLFVFASPDTPAFWMKDMYFDLDFIWMYKGKVVDIDTDVKKPNSPGDELPIYRPSSTVDMMLEVDAGFAQKEGVKVGDSVVVSE